MAKGRQQSLATQPPAMGPSFSACARRITLLNHCVALLTIHSGYSRVF